MEYLDIVVLIWHLLGFAKDGGRSYRWWVGRFRPDAYWCGLPWCLKHIALIWISGIIVSDLCVEVMAVSVLQTDRVLQC